MKERIKQFLTLPFLSDRRVLLGIWTLLSLVGMLKLHRSHNNFLIFKGVYWHTVNGTSLYAAYPSRVNSRTYNHYGPLFSLIIAPFALFTRMGWYAIVVTILSGWLFAAIYWSGLRNHSKSTSIGSADSHVNSPIHAAVQHSYCCYYPLIILSY